MRRVLAIASVFVFYSFISSWGAIINVPGDYPTIQQGIDASDDGDTVLVQPGTYVENINFNGHNIVLGSLFLTTGDTSFIPQTVVDGDTSGSVITFGSGEDSTSVIVGLCITNGHAGPPNCGGGICILNGSAPQICFNIIINNRSLSYGGAIYCIESNPSIIGNIIINNFALGIWISGGTGGGIYCVDSNPIIINNIFSENTGGDAGAIYSRNSQLLLSKNMFNNNTATGMWIPPGVCGGVYLDSSFAVMTYNEITNNMGGGIYSDFSSIILINNTMYGNFHPYYGSNFHGYNSDIIFTNNIFAGDSSENCEVQIISSFSAIVQYCSMQDTLWPGEGNINANPLFRDSISGDFHLTAIYCGDPYDSPCIDAGDPAILDSLLDCEWGLGELRSDMGAYGGEGIPTSIEGEDISAIPAEFILYQNYANPFNAQTTIKYNLPEPQDVSLAIYDLLGRQVETLLNKEKQMGLHQAIWDASGYSSGIYFYRIEAGDHTKTKKMILLK